MKHTLLVVAVLLSLSTAAADVPPQAQAAYVEAQALLRAGLKDDAAAALSRAIAAAPEWSAPRVLRARLLEPLALTDATARAAARFDESFDYQGALDRLAALKQDLAAIGQPEAGAPPDDVAWAGSVVEKANERAAALLNQHTTVRAQVLAQRAAEEADRKARVAAAQRLEAERAARAAYDAQTAGVRTRKGLGIAGTVLGGAAAVGAAVAVAASYTVVDDVRQGNIATGSDFELKLQEAGTLRSSGLGLGLAAAALLTGGLALWLTAAEPPPFVFVGVGPMTGGGLLSVSGSF